MDLTDRVALVTGGKRMGVTLASRLARHGVDVALSYNRSGKEAEEAAAAVRDAGRGAAAIRADLSSSRAVHDLVDATAARFGRLDIVVNMASTYRRTPLDALTDEDWAAALDIDLSAAWRVARAAAPHMRAAGGGRIVNFSDWTAASGRPRYTGYVAYYVAKRAVVALTEVLALELARDGILVNAVAPGPILPPPDLPAGEVEAVVRETPVGRWGGAEAIAGTVLELLQSDFVTGETVRVDGGRHLK